jgi:hypothetical protein
MKTQEFRRIIEQMKLTSVPRRMVYIWQGKASELEDVFKGIEVHRIDPAAIGRQENITEGESTHLIEQYLHEMTKKYEAEREEPAVLIVENAILLIRYNCGLTTILKFGISPRSMVVLLFPKTTSACLPPRAGGWIKNDTAGLIERVKHQLGDSQCVIDDSGDGYEQA